MMEGCMIRNKYKAVVPANRIKSPRFKIKLHTHTHIFFRGIIVADGANQLYSISFH